MTLPRSLAANPRLSTWISFDTPGRITVRVGKVELGQGILTALAQLAADELDVGFERIVMQAADTSCCPDEGTTAGSLSVMESGAALRQVCAEVRAVLLEAGATSYWELADTALDRDAVGSVRPRTTRSVVGTSQPRLDLPDKIAGRPRFIHDLELPGQMYGRVVRPPSPAATLSHLDPVDVPGIVVRDGSFLGVVSSREEVAVRASRELARAAYWNEHDSLPDADDLSSWLHTQPSEPIEVTGGPAVPGEIRARYTRPFLAHASIAPSCGVAVWNQDRLDVWSHSQNVHGLRRAVVQALAIPADHIVVRHVEGAGCYGHNAAEDAAFDAVLLARSVPGRPVQVVWSRADELSWAPFGPAMAVDIAASLDGNSTVASWQHDTWSPGHLARPGYAGTPGLLAAAHIADGHPLVPAIDPSQPAGGATRNAVPGYEFPNCRVTGHRILDMPLRTSALRSLGAQLNVFAIECHLDELAARAGRDPVEYRLAHLTDERARAVITRAAEAAAWTDWHPRESAGHGIGFARYKNSGGYCAVVAEVEAVHRVLVRRLVIAVDVGEVINPDGVRNQVEGGAVQATSWTLLEQVRFDRRRVTSTDWESYPILRFRDVPAVRVELLDRPGLPSLGAGEAAQGPTTAAIGNAVRDALGVALRDLPLTPERIADYLSR